MFCEVSVLHWWRHLTLNSRSWCTYVEYVSITVKLVKCCNIYVVRECNHQVQNVSSPLFTVWCSFRYGASWRNWKESSTKPQSLYYYFERGPRDHTSWGKCGFIDLHTLWVPKLINWTHCLVCKSWYFPVCLQCLVFLFLTGSGSSFSEWELSRSVKCRVCTQQQLVHNISVGYGCSEGTC